MQGRSALRPEQVGPANSSRRAERVRVSDRPVLVALEVRHVFRPVWTVRSGSYIGRSTLHPSNGKNLRDKRRREDPGQPPNRIDHPRQVRSAFHQGSKGQSKRRSKESRFLQGRSALRPEQVGPANSSRRAERVRVSDRPVPVALEVRHVFRPCGQFAAGRTLGVARYTPPKGVGRWGQFPFLAGASKGRRFRLPAVGVAVAVRVGAALDNPIRKDFQGHRGRAAVPTAAPLDFVAQRLQLLHDRARDAFIEQQ